MITVIQSLVKKSSFWVIFLLIISSVFRLSFLGNIEFKADEAEGVYQAYNFIHYHQFPTNGFANSIGIHYFPFFSYFLILLSLLRTDPQFLTFLIALLNVLIIPFYYLFINRFYSHGVAIFSSLLLALAPWEILYSRKIWSIDVLLIFSVPFLYFLHRLIFLKDSKAAFWTFLFGVLLIQIDFSGIFLMLITLIYLVWKRIKVNYFSAVKGTLLGALPTVPYLYYQFFSGAFCKDCTGFSQFIGTQYALDLTHFLRPFELLSIFYFSFELGDDYQKFFQSNLLLPFINFIGIISIALILFGIYHIITKERKHILLICYLIFLPIINFFCGVNSFMHLYVILMPIVALIAGIGLQAFMKRAKPVWLKAMYVASFLLLLTSFVIFECLFNTFLASQKVIYGDYGPIYSVGNTYLNKELKSYRSYPYYEELKYYAFIFLYTDGLHSRLGDFFAARHDYKDARKEYSIDTNTFPSTLETQ